MEISRRGLMSLLPAAFLFPWRKQDVWAEWRKTRDLCQRWLDENGVNENLSDGRTWMSKFNGPYRDGLPDELWVNKGRVF